MENNWIKLIRTLMSIGTNLTCRVSFNYASYDALECTYKLTASQPSGCARSDLAQWIACATAAFQNSSLEWSADMCDRGVRFTAIFSRAYKPSQ